MTTHRDALRELAEARPGRLTPDAPPADPIAFTAHPQQTRGLPTRRLVLAGGALVAAAAVGVTAIVVPKATQPPADTATAAGPAPAPQTAQDWLLVAATSSATAPARAGRYWVYRSEEAAKDHPTLVIEQWLSTVDRAPTAAYFRDPVSGAWSRRDMQGHSAANNFLLGGQGRSAQAIAALPADPDKLKAKLLTWYAGGDGDQADFLFYSASALVLSLPARPQVRSAAYRMLAGVPGITALGRVTDAAGRTGIAVAISHRGDSGAQGQVRLIIDPTTGAALAQERWTDGVRSSYTALLTAGWSNEDPPAAADIH
ncbi:hypothetical protein DFJ67_1818 [Asanoa ferruginea]|uniref:Uncharacterized protein n=1 Tax=Asanoa ferruginea TaxID=53367 RepID=A0A3D9ZF23_9ACTN|nr:CU044_5270 family protein [Asanoa ferruginea]REF95855.1 hypothetical protein DFJ67_1818 [Asanoa ferruginea]GIF53738.1 hypothetical protein Afe04nite_82770 [Asanoa ferruginea]